MEYSDRAEQNAYADGFADGQLNIIEEISDIIEMWYSPHSDDMGLTIRMIKDLIEGEKKEIESL